MPDLIDTLVERLALACIDVEPARCDTGALRISAYNMLALADALDAPSRLDGMNEDARFTEALEEATAAFWAAFAARYPEAATGDLDVDSVVAFDDAVGKAAREWLRLNSPAGTAATTP